MPIDPVKYRKALELELLRISTPSGRIQFEGGDDEERAQILELNHTEGVVSAHNELLIRKIWSALDRIKRGEFGVCPDCGEEISGTRLDAVPWEVLCLECKKGRNEGIPTKKLRRIPNLRFGGYTSYSSHKSPRRLPRGV